MAVLIPCRNEAIPIAKVIRDFKAALPDATIYVYDNASTDSTAAVARRENAVVRFEPYPGKGNVIRRMFADIDADIYVMVDGDDTYDAALAPRMIAALVDGQLDMVNGARSALTTKAYRFGHATGNRVLTGIVQWVFGKQLNDMLSGYRVLSRRFVKSFPIMSAGFEIETELTVHALELRMKIEEISTEYRARPTGSASKLNAFRDGMRILLLIARLIKEERPLPFFLLLSAGSAVLSLTLAAPVFHEFMTTGLVPRLPTAVLSAALMLTSFLSIACGLILDSVTRSRREMKRLVYLALPVPGGSQS